MTCAVANTTTIHSGTSLFRERAAIIARVVPRGKEHLRVLRYSRLVHERRVGRERLYQLDPVPLQKVAGWIEGYRAFWQTSLNNLKRHLERKAGTQMSPGILCPLVGGLAGPEVWSACAASVPS